MIVGRTTLKVEDVTTALQENGRMMQMEYVNCKDRVLVVEESGQGRTQNRGRQDDYYGRSKSRPRELSEIECCYCGKKGTFKRVATRYEWMLRS